MKKKMYKDQRRRASMGNLDLAVDFIFSFYGYFFVCLMGFNFDVSLSKFGCV